MTAASYLEAMASHYISGGEGNREDSDAIAGTDSFQLLLNPSLDGLRASLSRAGYEWRNLPLYRAATKGDWESVAPTDENYRCALIAEMKMSGEPVLHMAVAMGEKAIHFVEELVKVMRADEIKVRDRYGRTALHIAAAVGNTKAANMLVQKNEDLLHERCDRQRLPATQAAVFAQRETLDYLISAAADNNYFSLNPFPNQNDVKLLNNVIYSEYFDVAMNLVMSHPHLATKIPDMAETPLVAVTETPAAFAAIAASISGNV
ncbi:hypothetical protein NMG60_11029970 [Bertholletia excelsa]